MGRDAGRQPEPLFARGHFLPEPMAALTGQDGGPRRGQGCRQEASTTFREGLCTAGASPQPGTHPEALLSTRR